MLTFIVIFFLAFWGSSHGDTKTWQRDVNFGNRDNWSNGKVPCASDSIIFPETIGVVYMQTNSTLKEIRLPSNGALVLGNNIQLAFSDDDNSQPDCAGQEQVFTHNASESWFNPANWEGSNGAIVVDTESVPCQYDQAIFPQDKLFYVGIDTSTTLSTILLSGEHYTSTSSFLSFLRSPSGQQQFSLSNNPSVQLQNRQCGDLTGCSCGNDEEPVRSKICGLREGSCPALTCSAPPRPIGGCCDICGAILTMEYNAQTFSFADFKSKIENNYRFDSQTSLESNSANSLRKKRQSASGVQMYMSKTRENKIQMVLTDSNSGSSSGQSAVSMASDIEQDIRQNLESYGLTRVSSESSQKGTGGQTGGMSGGGIAGIIVAVIVIICIVSTALFMFLRRNSFNFNLKDEPLHADSDLEMAPGMPPGFMQEIPNPAYDSAVRGFDNPMYGPTKENLYADPADVKMESKVDSQPELVVEEKGAINGPQYDEDDNVKSFTNSMPYQKQEDSTA